MSRYASQLPFTPLADFEALRCVTLNGVNYVPGQKIDKSGIDDRRLRALYEQRRIAPLDPGAPAAAQEAASGQPGEGGGAGADTTAGEPVEQQAATTATESGEALGSAPLPSAEPSGDAAQAEGALPASSAPAYAVQKAGMGGWHVVDAQGAPVGPSHKTKAAAEAACAALLAPKG